MPILRTRSTLPAALVLLLTGPPPSSGEGALLLQEHIRRVARDVSPAVVYIGAGPRRYEPPAGGRPDLPEAYRHYYDPGLESAEDGLGSGVIVDSSGHIITNRHVVEQLASPRVRLHDGRILPATLVGISRHHDIALLKVEAENLSPIAFASPDEIAVGTLVLAFGSPFGLDQSMSFGLISAIRQDDPHLPARGRILQTDAAINPGNSGGPLVNLEGQLVGINTALFSESGGSQGVGFAIPSEVVRVALAALERRATRTAGWLGVRAAPSASGLRLVAVVPGSPAGRSGLEAGDRILDIDSESIPDEEALSRVLDRHAPGDSVKIRYLRDSKLRMTSVTLGSREPIPAAAASPAAPPRPPAPPAAWNGKAP